MSDKKYDVLIIGGGHNGLVAATYLARAGKKVRIVEANPEIGGASQSVQAFPDYDANLSRYSYLIALLPDKIVADLGLSFECVSREVSSYTPYGDNKGLYVSRVWDSKTEQSFLELDPSGKEGRAWQDFYTEVAEFAQKIAPTLLEPLKTRSQLRQHIDLDSTWQYLIEEPIGKVITERFSDDVVRGVVLTDALIGTFASAFDMQANICFLYHLIGNGTGEWKVPKGGMGALVNELVRVATEAGVEISLNTKATNVTSQSDGVEVTLANGEAIFSDYLLSNAAPQVLAQLRGTKAPESLDGSQMKINILLKRLPQLKSGIDPRLAFAGTFHANESFSQFEKVYEDALQGVMPEKMPIEMYCHTLSDPSILGEDLQDAGYHTLTLFGLHTPASLFDDNNDVAREKALQSALASLNQYLAEPIEDVIAAIEVKTPLDIQEAIALPRGNIFHKDLSMPFREDGTPESWGVETDDPRIFICGAGAIRGGGVSGIPGHNAAMAILSNN
ncbi:MAG: NAD(P)/FAD-dependent oxidoreductase [Candidatus Planktophila sp.]|nr:NAD(P)/FAD-dependent oxidoreductase [Candidatus Planktophila sp.]